MLVKSYLPVGADAIDGPVDIIHAARSTCSSSQPRLNLIRSVLAQVGKVAVHLFKFSVPIIDDILGRLEDKFVEPLIDIILVINKACMEFVVSGLYSGTHLSLSLRFSFG